jgi:TP901 family phage tail tape measure protein
MAGPITYKQLFDELGPGAAELIEFTKAVQGLGRNYRAFAKNIDEDKARVQAALDAVKVQAGLITTQATQLSALNEQERAGFARLQAQVSQLIAEQKRLTEVQAAQAKAQNTVKDATQQAQSVLRAMQNELREAYAAKDTARIEAAAGSIRKYKTETQQLSLALRGTNTQLTAARGSYDALDAENKKLILSLRALGTGMGGSSQEAAKLEKQIADNTERLKDFDARILIFNRNVGNYASGFSGLVQELAKARTAQAGLAAGSEEYNRQQIKVNGFLTEAQRQAAKMGLSYDQATAKIEGTVGAIQPLVTNLVRLEKEQADVAVSTGKESEAFRVLGFQIERTKKEIDDVAVATETVEQKQRSFAEQIGFTREGLTQFAAGLIISQLGLQALLNGVEAVFEANVEYSRNLAEVRKTTGLTADEADRLGESLKKLDTPTNLAGLLKIAGIAGQLGVAKGDLLEFTTAIDTAVQALGNDFKGGPEEIATVLGKLTTVFRKELGPDVAQNILSIGSAINQLGAEGAATSPFLAEVALRTGQASSQFNLGLKNALAYAAVLEETGTTAEVAGSSLNRLYSTLGNRTKEAFAIAQKASPSLTLKEFTRLVNTDFNQAIQLFLKGLNAGNASTTEVNARLATLKLQSGEAKNAILALSQNTELFAQRQATANAQLREGTSLATEAAVNTETLGGSVDKLKNSASNFVTSGAGSGFLKFLVDFERDALKLTVLPFRLIGDGIDYIKEKLGISTKPLEDYTVGIVTTTQAMIKQSAAQQQLLDSYTKLAGQPTRTGAEEKELAELRAKLGTANVATIQAEIAARKDQVARNKAFLRQGIEDFDKTYNEASQRAAQAQDALSVQASALDAAQLARVREIAKARLDANRPLTGASSNPALEPAIAAATRLLKLEREIAENRRNRANNAAALAKLEGANTQAKKDGADAAAEQEKAEAQLDRAAVERAKNLAAALRDELDANQRRIEETRKYQAEQAKLFADKQITSEIFAASVAGSEDEISGYERNGAAIRIRIARAESAEKLAQAENDRVRQRKKKDITQAELTDIERQYSLRRKRFASDEAVALEKIDRDLAEKLKVTPLEFKVAVRAENGEEAYQSALRVIERQASQETEVLRTQYAAGLVARQAYEDELIRIRLKAAARAQQARKDYPEDREVTYQRELTALKSSEQLATTFLTNELAERKITQSEYEDKRLELAENTNNAVLELNKKYYKKDYAAEDEAANIKLAKQQAAARKRLKLAEYIEEQIGNVGGYYFQQQQQNLNTQAANEQAAKEKELKAAGDNEALKAQITEKYDKLEAKRKYDQAVLDRKTALFQIALNTAVAVTRVLSTSTYADFGISAGVLSAIVVANGVLQAGLVLSQPLPAYFKGRQSGPAELATLAERGPELVGQERTGFRLVAEQGVGYLAAGDRVYTAPETQQILAQNDLVEGRLVQRAQQVDLETQTTRLRSGAAEQQAAERAAMLQATQPLLDKMEQVRRAIQEQEYYRLNEQDDMVRRSEVEGRRRDKLEKRYKGRG